MGKFSIRDLLWLTALAAVCLNWYLNNAQLKRTNRRRQMALHHTESHIMQAQREERLARIRANRRSTPGPRPGSTTATGR